MNQVLKDGCKVKIHYTPKTKHQTIMKIKSIKQIAAGQKISGSTRQNCWEIELTTPPYTEEELLAFCSRYIDKRPRSYEDFKQAMESTTDINEKMSIAYEGYYVMRHIEGRKYNYYTIYEIIE